MIQYKKDIDHIAVLNLDMKDRTVNIFNHEIVNAFVPVVEHLKKEKEKGKLKGIILTSSKKTFLTGGDLDYLMQNNEPKDIFNYSQKVQKFFRDLENPGVPVVAAINGSVLGSGFELALACHKRIVVDDPKIKIGLPEVNLGLMTGGGASIRLLWLLGIEKAYEVLTSKKIYNPKQAYECGIVDELVSDEDQMMEAARRWILEQKESKRIWDLIPGSSPIEKNNINTLRLVQQMTARSMKDNQGNFPAFSAILNTLAEGLYVDFDTACKIESRYFAELLQTKECKNMMKTFWFDLNKIKNNDMRPKGYGKFRPKKVGIIGAGNMGSGIAISCLLNGLNVVMKDVSKSVVLMSKEYIGNRFLEMLQQNKITKAVQESALANFTSTDDAKDFKDCDIVIEAVFENKNVKVNVTKEAEIYLDQYAILGTNTVSISITELGAQTQRPENFIGLHFFSPVEDVPLCEVVKGKLTSDETVARAFDFVKKIKKTPILIKDNWGFFSSRVQNTFILEGVQMLQEGYPAALIENLAYQAGMRKGALALADTLSLNLVLNYEQQAAKHYGPKYIAHPAVTPLKIMIEEAKRPGRPSKSGFYDYDSQNAERLKLWENLTDHFPMSRGTEDNEELKERLLFVQVLEALWVLYEGVVKSVPEANLGSIYGWGFPSFRGGVIQYICDYGKEAFVAKCKQLEKVHGPRFKVPSNIDKVLDDTPKGKLQGKA